MQMPFMFSRMRSALRDSLAPYVSAGRRISASQGGSTAGRKRRRSGQQDYSAVRAWAKENGYSVSERGRVPASVLEAYNAAN